jgi:hypothetical protein
MSLFEEASLVITPNAFKAGKLYAVKGADLDVTRATGANRINPSGANETMGANVPRIDYTSGGCPSILVEPQRTNLLIQSNNFNSLVWLNSGATITPNSIISPDGTQNATKLTILSGQYLYQLISVTASNVYTISFYAKVLSGTKEFRFNVFGGGNNFTSSIYTVNTQWQRFNYTFTASATAVVGIYPVLVDGLTGGDFYIYGSQTESGSYATSYIPTTSASVTRNADVISKTGISSLIGQTEGTIFVDVIALPIQSSDSGTYLSIEDWGNFKLVRIYRDLTSIHVQIYNSANIYLANFSISNNQNYKVAIAYSQNGASFYINGTLINENTSSLSIPTCSNVRIGSFTSSQETNASINSAVIWKERLTNTELAELTTL